MKSKNRFGKHSDEHGESELTAAADFHRNRMSQEVKFETSKESSNSPQGNYEYEQRVAEDASFNTKRMIAEAAFFIAEHRGFVSGQEESDWLQAEMDVEDVLRSAQQVSLSSSAVTQPGIPASE